MPGCTVGTDGAAIPGPWVCLYPESTVIRVGLCGPSDSVYAGWTPLAIGAPFDSMFNISPKGLSDVQVIHVRVFQDPFHGLDEMQGNVLLWPMGHPLPYALG